MVQCRAKSKQSGQQCKRDAMHGKAVCYMHGGKTPSGIASPHFKNGATSRAMPARMMARYEQALDDPELLNLRQDLAVIESRLNELLQRVDSDGVKSLWEKMQEITGDLRTALKNKDHDKVAAAADELNRITQNSLTDYESWSEIYDVIEQRRRLVESEQKRLVAMQQVVTTEQAMLFATSLLMIVKENVTDRHTLQAIQDSVSKLLNKAEVVA